MTAKTAAVAILATDNQAERAEIYASYLNASDCNERARGQRIRITKLQRDFDITKQGNVIQTTAEFMAECKATRERSEVLRGR